MSLGSRLTLVVTCLTLIPGPCRAQNDCFTSSSIVGAVLGTFFSTAVALALLVFLLWWIYYRRTPNGADRQGKGARVVESGSGFDNPCFEANPNSDVVDGGKPEKFGQKQDAQSTSWTPLRFFGANKNEKKRSMDDSFISEPERVSVQLRGHDFTGLGFNVTGNMRDGIFIKDILNRGPAFESGKIAPGDRILNVTISFRHVVYEDALTILSYASPYDVTMELEKGLRNNSSTLKKRKAASTVSLASTSPSATLSTIAGSVQQEGPPNERLVHPLYRSQSIDDLSKVGRADVTVRADMRIPSLAGHVSGGLAKSKLLGKANLDMDVPTVPDIKLKGGNIKPASANVVLDAGDISVAPPNVSLAIDPRPPKVSKFGIKVLPDLKFKAGAKGAEVDMPLLPTGLDVPEAELNLPKVEIHTPKASDLAINIDVPDGSGIKLPTRNVSMAIDMPEQEYPTAVGVGGDVKLNIGTPSLNLSAPVGVTDINFEGPKMNQPNIDVNLPAAPNVSVDFQSPSLPDVAVGQEIHNADISLDLSKTPKPGFHIKFPKFGGSKTVKGDMPEVGVQLAAPELDVALPETNVEMDPKLKKDGAKAGFEFKMPKLSLKKKPEIALEAKTMPTINVDVPEVDVDVKIPGASVEVQPPAFSASAPDVELPSVSMDVKKPKIDFSMPKFNMGKDQAELKNTIDVDVDIAGVKIEKTSSSDSDTDDDNTEGGKKKLKFGKMPKFGFNKPQGEIEISAPDASADVELPSVDVDVGDIDVDKGSKKSKFGMKMPKFGASATVPDVSLDLDASHGIDVKLPSVETKAETSDSSDDDDDENGDKKKKGFNIKMPKFGLPKAEMSGPKIDVQADLPSIKPLEGKLEVGVPNLSGDVLRMQSDTEDTDNEDDAKKKGKSLKIKSPELQFTGGATNLDVRAPSLELSTPGGPSEFKVKGPKLDQPNIDVTVPTGASLDLDFKLPSLPDVPANPEIPHAEASIEAGKTGKSGFHIKFPKFGGSKTVKVDAPDASAKIAMPEVDVALPEANVEIDPKLKKDGSKAGFEFKMPKLSLKKKHEVTVETKPLPTLNTSIPEVDVDVKVPGASVDIQPPSLSASGPDVDLPSVSVDVKKPKTGFSMPKFNMGKGHGELKGSGNVALSMPTVTADVKQGSASSDSEDDSEGGTKKMKFGKMPKFELNKPEIQLETSTQEMSGDVNIPSVGIDVDDAKISKKGNFGIKMPTFGAGASVTVPEGSLALDTSHGVDVNLPSAEIKGETSDSSDDDEDENGDKKKKRFNIKMPKFGLPKGDIAVNAPKIDLQAGSSDLPDIKPLEGNLEIDVPKITTSFSKASSHSDETDSEDGSKKRSKGAFDIKAAVPDLDAKLAVDAGNLDASLGEAKKGSKLGIKLPKMKIDRPNLKRNENSDSDSSSDDDDEGKRLKGSIAIPSIDLSGPNVDLQGDVGLPNAQFGMKANQPKVDLEADVGDDDHDDDENKKKSSKFGFSIKMPKFHMKKKSEDRDLSAHLNLDSASGGTDDDRSGEDKKKGKASAKLPKFGLKKPDLDADFGADVKIEDKDKMTFSLPEVTIEKPKLEVGLDSSMGAEGSAKFGVDMGKGDLNPFPVDIGMSGQVQPPSVPDVGFSVAGGMNPQADIKFKGLDLELEHDDSDDEKKKSKFFKMPKFHMGKHHGEAKVEHGAKINLPDAELSLPTGKLELDPNVSIDVSSKDDADSDDDKKESSKKKTRFGIKMPKFQMKHSHAPGVNVDVKAEGVKIPSLEANVDALVVEHDSISSDNTSIEMDLPRVPELNPVDVDVTVPHGKLEIPEKDGKKKGKFSFKSNFKMPKLHMSSGKGHADLEVPSTEINLPKVEVDLAGKGEIDVDDAEKKKSSTKLGAAFHMPKIDKPSANIDVSIPTVGLDLKGDAKHDDSDDENKKADKSKSGGFAFKMPKLSGGGKAEIGLPEMESQLNVKAPSVEMPKLEASLDLDEGDLDKKSPFIVKMPAFNPVKPDIQLDVSKTKTDSDSDDSDSENEKSKKGFKLGFKMPHLSMGGKGTANIDTDLNVKVEHPEQELPSVGAEVSLPKTDVSAKKKGNFEGNFKMPSFGLKGAGGAQKADESDDSDSDDEKSKKGFKLGFKMPDFSMGGKGDVSLDADVKNKQLEQGLPTLEADVSLPEAELSAKKKGSFGANFKMPTFSSSANVDVSGAKQANTSDDSSDSEDENSKKGLKLGFKMPKLSLGGKTEANLDSDANLNVKLPETELPSIEAEASLPEADLSMKKKSGFGAHFKMPTFSAKGNAGDAEKTRESDDSSDSDDENSKKGLKLGFKMPKLSMGGKTDANLDTDATLNVKLPEQELPSLEAEASLPEADLSMKKKSSFGAHFKMPSFSPKANVRVGGDEKIHGEDDSSDSDDENTKKGLKFGLKMPKLSMGGKTDVDLDTDANLNVKLPEQELPSVDAELSLPDADLTTKKASFGSHFKMPTFSTKANVSATGAEKIEASDDSSDSEDEKSKKGFKLGFKMPDFSMGGKADVNLDSESSIKAKQPELNLPNVDVDVSLPETDQSTKKKSSFGSHFKMPSFSPKANVRVSGAEKTHSEDESSDSEDEESKKGLKLGFKMPKLSMSGKDGVTLDSEATKLKKPEPNLPSVEVDMSLPETDLTTKKKASFGSHFKMPTFSTKANVSAAGPEVVTRNEDSSDSDDENSKKGLKLGFKMPDLSVKGKGDLSLDSDPNIKLKQPSPIEAEVSLPEVDVSAKKKGGFGSHFKMPTFSAKANVGSGGAEQENTSDDSSDSEDENSKKGLKMGFKMPKLSASGKNDINLDSDVGVKVKLPDQELPSVEVEASLPEADLSMKKKSSFGSHFKMPSFSPKANVRVGGVEKTHAENESSDSEDESSKKGLKLGLKMPKLSMGGKGDVDLDSDANLNVKLPEHEVPSLEAEASLPEADLSMKKKSGGFGAHFKMPTFSTKGKVSDAEKTHESDDSSDSEDENSKKGLKLGFKMPKLSASGKTDIHLDSDANVNVKLPEGELPSLEAEASLPDADPSMKKKSGFGAHFKMPTFSAKGNVSASGADKSHASDDSSDSEDENSKKGLKLGFKMPKLSMGGKTDVDLDSSDANLKVKLPEQELPSADAELSLPDADLTTKKKSSFGSHFKMPTFSAKAKAGASGADQADTSDSSSDSEDENSKKGLKLDLKVPDLSVSGKSDVDVDPELTIKAKQPELNLPTVQVGMSPPEAELATKKKSSFGSHFKMPTFSAKTNVGSSVPENVHASDDSSDSENEKSKKGFKFGIKMPDLSMGGKGDANLSSDVAIKHPEPEAPVLNAEVSLPEVDVSMKKKSSFGSHFKMPSFSTKANVGASAELPEIDVVTPRVQIEEEHELDDSEKKSHKIGIKLPKFQTRQRNAEVTLPQVELKSEDSSHEEDSDKESKVKVKKPKFGIKLPEFNKPKLEAGVNVPSQNLAGSTVLDVDLPQVGVEVKQPVAGDASNVDIQVDNIDAEVAKVKAQLAQLQAEFDIQSGKQQPKIKEDDSSSSSSDSETEKESKNSGMNFGLKLPKFSIGKEKTEAEPKLEATLPSVSLKTKTTGDDMTSPSLSSLEVEPVKLESGSGHEKEKKKFSLGLKMPKFPSKGGNVAVESEVASSSKDLDTVPVSKSVKVNVKAPKMKLKKKKGDHHQSSSSDSDSEEEHNDEEDQPRSKDATGNTQTPRKPTTIAAQTKKMK
ncbi:hypothetical protein GHT06_022475 [Daphnia sinensis]|uniref:PDZ domain-containing protein n=1 Tax=Daphnia sinensis TaxID=1820382 RepID=A0AAD5L6T8_9CRUS|nr:hypothetical protein GHT06_022475 [Daphnia sinensis]